MGTATSSTASDQRTRPLVRELHAGPREEFVSRRTELAQRLAAEGDRSLAAEVRALRKPTLLAWAIDQAVIDDPTRAEQLVETVAAMQAPADGKRMRTLADGFEQLVDELARAADAAIGGGRRADLAAAIRIAAVSSEAQRFVDGALVADPAPGDDSLAAALAAGAAGGAGAARRPTRGSGQAGSRGSGGAKLRERRRELRGQLAQARSEQRGAKADARRADRDVARRQAELDAALQRAARATAAVSEAAERIEAIEREIAALDD